MSDISSIPPANMPPSTPPPSVITIDAAMLSGLGKFIGYPILASLMMSLMGAVSGYVQGHVLLQGVKDAVPKVPGGILPKIPNPFKAEEAIGRITFGNSGCTASIMGPMSPGDDKIDILTAAHCVQVGQVGKMKLKDGRTLTVRCVTRDAAADCAWLIADRPAGDVPFLLLADSLPPEEATVWHQGYGIDRPGNRESGEYMGTDALRRQCRFTLSVSPGDSGGAIVVDQSSRVLSPVCCTTRLSGRGTVWGASPQACAAIRPNRKTPSNSAAEVNPVLPLPSELWPDQG